MPKNMNAVLNCTDSLLGSFSLNKKKQTQYVTVNVKKYTTSAN